MRSVDEDFYNSKKWRQVSEDYKKSVGGLCERCRKKGLFVPAKITHHKIHLTPENIKDPSVSYNFKNLEALCQDCHNREHFNNSKRWRFSKSGELILDEDGPPI